MKLFIQSEDKSFLHEVTITKEEWDMYRVICLDGNIDQSFEKDDILELLEDLPWLI